MVYYTDADGNLLPWSARGHEEGATQYNEWAVQYWREGDNGEPELHTEAHANAIPDLIGSGHASDSCLECHSADYRMAEEGEKPTVDEVKYSDHLSGLPRPAPAERPDLALERGAQPAAHRSA